MFFVNGSLVNPLLHHRDLPIGEGKVRIRVRHPIFQIRRRRSAIGLTGGRIARHDWNAGIMRIDRIVADVESQLCGCRRPGRDG